MNPPARSTLCATAAALAAFVFFGGGRVPESAPLLSPNLQPIQSNASEIAELSARLRSGDEEERRDAVLQLSAIHTRAALSALASALNDKSERVRATAVTALGDADDPELAGLIIKLLTSDKSRFVRKSAAYALARQTGARRASALVTALKDKDPEVRGAAAVALAHHPDTSAIAELRQSLADSSPFVRAEAARALGMNGRDASEATQTLIGLLGSDKDHEVRRQAASALGRIGDRSALTALEVARRDPDPHLSQAAEAAIRMLEERRP